MHEDGDIVPTRHLRGLVKRGREVFLARIIPFAVLAGVLLAVAWAFSSSAPAEFAAPRIIRIDEGETLSAEARLLKESNAIRSETIFKAVAVMLGGERGLIAGDYYFAVGENVFSIASRLTSGKYNLDPLRVTIPEGSTVREIAEVLGNKLAYFDTKRFLELAEGKEGYLFPDTYYFLPTEDPARVIQAMENNFYKRIDVLRPVIESSGHTLHEIVTMASLLEEEARTPTSRRMISGILWNRIAIGMKLQVDAVFPYIIGKNTFTVTKKDLTFDSPYNTYLYPGLPLGPIDNPGLVSIEAAVRPTKNNYIFYLSDMQGGMHYSRTYAEHLRKQRFYLNSGY